MISVKLAANMLGHLYIAFTGNDVHSSRLCTILLNILVVMGEELKVFQNICRTCLRENEQLFSVFDIVVSEIHQIRLTDILRKISSIKIIKGDGLPQQICSFCIGKVGEAFSFAQKCEDSDKSLRQYIRKINNGNATELAIQKLLRTENLTEINAHSSVDNVHEQTIITIQHEKIEETLQITTAANKEEEEEESGTETNVAVLPEEVNVKQEIFQKKKEKVREVVLSENEYIHEENYENVEEQCGATTDKESNKTNKAELTFSTSMKYYRLKKFPCPDCPDSFNTKEGLEKHKKFHDPKNMFKCKECGKSFGKNAHLKVHLRSHISSDEKPHQCDVCNKSFAYVFQLKQHSYKHTDEKPFPCTVCKKGCLTSESLRRHMTTHEKNYEENRKKHQCEICLKEFAYPSFLAEHMKNHTGDKPFLCMYCGKEFRQSGALDHHIRSHTGYKPYTCEICSKKFMARGSLTVHMRCHTGERPYKCDICNKGFRQCSDMKSHKRIHTGERPIECPVCEKKMSTTGQLTVHLRSHTGEKPYKCMVCYKQFATRNMLIKHNRVHTGEKPFVCAVCGRSFSQNNSLKTHMGMHEREKAKQQLEANKLNFPKIEFEAQNVDICSQEIIAANNMSTSL